MIRFVSIGDLVTDVYYDKELKLIGADGGITTHNIICNLQSMGFNTFAFGACGDDFLGKISIKSLDDCGVKNNIYINKKIKTKAYHIRNILVDGKYCYKSIMYCPYCRESSWYDGSYINETDILSKLRKNDVLIFDNLNSKNQFIIDNTINIKLLDLGLYNEFESLEKDKIIDKLRNKFELINLNERVEKYLLNKLNCINDLELFNILNAKLIIITRGKRGNDFIFDGQVINFPIKEIVEEVDDSGAGDAFFSTIIKNYFQNNMKFTKEDLEKWFEDTLPYVRKVLLQVGSRAHIKKMYDGKEVLFGRLVIAITNYYNYISYFLFLIYNYFIN